MSSAEQDTWRLTRPVRLLRLLVLLLVLLAVVLLPAVALLKYAANLGQLRVCRAQKRKDCQRKLPLQHVDGLEAMYVQRFRMLPLALSLENAVNYCPTTRGHTPQRVSNTHLEHCS
jgi:hypothetical protein